MIYQIHKVILKDMFGNLMSKQKKEAFERFHHKKIVVANTTEELFEEIDKKLSKILKQDCIKK